MDRNLIIDYFLRFSIFECALKRSGYLLDAGERGAKPNWDAFIIDLQDQFFDDAKADARCGEIFKKAPKKQIVIENRLDWREVGLPANKAEVVHAALRIRNNLFHGGKYATADIEEVARNAKLLQAGIAILELAADHASSHFVAELDNVSASSGFYN